MGLWVVSKEELVDLGRYGAGTPDNETNLISGKTPYGDTTVIGSQAEMSRTPEAWADPITAPPGSSYSEWLSTK